MLTDHEYFEAARPGLLCPKCSANVSLLRSTGTDFFHYCLACKYENRQKGDAPFIETAIFTETELTELVEKVRKGD
jgi:hypothetical protein